MRGINGKITISKKFLSDLIHKTTILIDEMKCFEIEDYIREEIGQAKYIVELLAEEIKANENVESEIKQITGVIDTN